VLAPYIARVDGETIELSNNVVIEIQTASFRSIRGYTIIGALCDEIAFWRSEESAGNPDTEILNPLRPAIATVPGSMLLCAPRLMRGAVRYGRLIADIGTSRGASWCGARTRGQ
jgi:hypothetical protein